MEILSLASNASIQRGYEYFRDCRVMSCSQTGENLFEGLVSGTMPEPYQVRINLAHPRESVCSCPFAEGSKKVCKHEIAMFFSAFPEEAEKYRTEIEQKQKEAEECEERREQILERRISEMTEEEAKTALYQILTEGPEWRKERFLWDWTEE